MKVKVTLEVAQVLTIQSLIKNEIEVIERFITQTESEILINEYKERINSSLKALDQLELNNMEVVI